MTQQLRVRTMSNEQWEDGMYYLEWLYRNARG